MGDAAAERRARDVARYPKPRDVTRAVLAARDIGMHVSSIEVRRDGAIRVGDRHDAPAQTLFDAWDKANKL